MAFPPCFAGAEVDFDAVVAVGLVSAMIVFFRVELLGFKLKKHQLPHAEGGSS
jgi:hypothetical protein